MPPLAGFSDNPFESKEHVRKACLALLQSLQQYQSHGGARIRIPVATGTHYDETAAQLEGYARPLWAVGALLAGSFDDDGLLRRYFAPFVQGLANGTDPDHPEYWGPVTGTDQRMVEMEIISFALLAAPSIFFYEQVPKAKVNIISWLRNINGRVMPTNNWRWFRVLTNLALIKVCSLPHEELRPFMDQDLDVLDSFYIEHGWSSDGPWDAHRVQTDYYSGSFAIQFSQMLYVKFARDIDPARCIEFRKRARSFAADFFLYFDHNGAAIPYGRSLTYRFAFAGFWSVAAYAEVELPHPLNDYGVVKSVLLRHLRWWSLKDEMFNVDGTLNIGFTYPNMFMCEDYNSPQSVYWCMKSFIALALPDTHEFWRSDERPVPADSIPLFKVVKAARQIVCNSKSHHFVLSSGQNCPWPLKATEAKYGKFAYSSHFAFSVPTGPLIEQIAPDSTLALSVDGGDTWKVRWLPVAPRFDTAILVNGAEAEEVAVLLSSWKPWPLLDVNVTTALIAPSRRWPDWHIRIHNVSANLGPSTPSIAAIEGGFAIYARKSTDGLPIPPASDAEVALSTSTNVMLETSLTNADGCCVFSREGASGIRQLTIAGTPSGLETIPQSEGFLLKPDSNTNLMHQRTMIPTTKIVVPTHGQAGIYNYLMAQGVFATTDRSGKALEQWNDPPVVRIGEGKLPNVKAYIELKRW